MGENVQKRRALSVMLGALALVVAFSLFGIVQQAQAADYAVGSIATQASTVKKVVKGTIKSGTKVTKTFIMPKKGYVTFSVSIPKGLLYTALRIDYGDVRYVNTSIQNGSAGGGAGKFTSKRFSFAPGKKIKVTLELPGGILSQKLSYKITMKHKAPTYYERESNSNKSKATALKQGKVFGGNILKKDKDWFVFKAPEAGTYRFAGKMTLPGGGEIASANMTLYQGSKSLGTKNPVSGNGYVRLGTLTLKKGAKVYVKVTPFSVSLNTSLPTGVNLPSSIQLPEGTTLPYGITLPTGSGAAAGTGASTGSSSTLDASALIGTSADYALKVLKVK